MRVLFLFLSFSLVLCLGSSRLVAQLTPDSLVGLSIAHHDPMGQWRDGVSLQFLLREERTAGDRITRLTLYPKNENFALTQEQGETKTRMRRLNGTVEFELNGDMDPSDAEIRAHRLTEGHLDTLRNYYAYLYGLPMKLRDPGTILGDEVRTVTTPDGEKLLELKVSYAEGVGNDVWFFRFEPETYALREYRFYHADQGPSSGEYIHLKGERKVAGMLLPADRTWYLTQDSSYLARDVIVD